MALHIEPNQDHLDRNASAAPLETTEPTLLTDGGGVIDADTNLNTTADTQLALPAATEQTTGETSPARIPEASKNHSRRNKIGALVAGAALVIGMGAAKFMSGGDSSNESVKQGPAATEQEVEAFDPATDSTTGNIRITAILASDTNPNTGSRPNGETITVPKLRDADLQTEDGQEAYMNSVFANMSAYFSTGDEKFLNELTNNPNLKDLLRDFEQEHYGKTHGTIGTEEDWQAVVFDNPDNPASYRAGSDPIHGKYIELDGGEVYVGYGSSKTFNSPETHDANPTLLYNYVVERFRIYLTNPADGAPKVADMQWHNQD